MSLARSRSLFFLAFLRVRWPWARRCIWIWGRARALSFVGAAVFSGRCSLVCLVAAVHGPSALGMLPVLAGEHGRSVWALVTAWRHVLLQNVCTDQLVACCPAWSYMLENLSLALALKLIFRAP